MLCDMLFTFASRFLLELAGALLKMRKNNARVCLFLAPLYSPNYFILAVYIVDLLPHARSKHLQAHFHHITLAQLW